jgi:hypothetical protein
MDSERLLEIPANLKLYSGLADFSDRLRRGSSRPVELNAVNLAEAIRSIKLPPANLS